MSGFAVKKIDEMEALFGGGFKRARAELGVESFGMQIIDMPPNYEGYPEHDHDEDGQEEVYVTLRGGGELEIEGERFPLDADHVARVGPGVKRKVWPGDEAFACWCSAASRARPTRLRDITKLGEPGPDGELRLARDPIKRARRPAPWRAGGRGCAPPARRRPGGRRRRRRGGACR